MGAVFERLTPDDLHAHIRYVAGSMPSHRAEIVLGAQGVEIPILRQTYARLPNRLGLLLRVSSLGRPALDQVVRSVQVQGIDLKLRKSAREEERHPTQSRRKTSIATGGLRHGRNNRRHGCARISAPSAQEPDEGALVNLGERQLETDF